MDEENFSWRREKVWLPLIYFLKSVKKRKWKSKSSQAGKHGLSLIRPVIRRFNIFKRPILDSSDCSVRRVHGSLKDDCPDENAEIKIEVIENDVEPKTEPEIIDLPATVKLSEVCTLQIILQG